MSRPGRDPSDELMNMRVIYGSPPEPTNHLDKLGPCVHCGKLASEHGGNGNVARARSAGWCPDGNGGWGYDTFEAKVDEKMKAEVAAVVEVMKREPAKVDAPPPYAGSDEIRIISLLETLDERARLRVIRYALSRWAVVGLGGTE